MVEIREKAHLPVTLSQIRVILTLVFDGIFDDQHLKKFLSARKNADLFEYVQIASRHYRSSRDLGSVGYLRTGFTSELVGQFLSGVAFEENPEFPSMSRVYLGDGIRTVVEILKRFTYIALIGSARLKVAERRGREIVRDIFTALSGADGHSFLPEDFKAWFNRSTTVADRRRVICDFVAGMTDRYAVEFHARLRSESPESIFKPL
jgi:dGTPase